MDQYFDENIDYDDNIPVWIPAIAAAIFFFCI
jgi:hypothetical protein